VLVVLLVVVLLVVLLDVEEEEEVDVLVEVLVLVEVEVDVVVAGLYTNVVVIVAEEPSPPHVALMTYVPATQQGFPPQDSGPPATVTPL